FVVKRSEEFDADARARFAHGTPANDDLIRVSSKEVSAREGVAIDERPVEDVAIPKFLVGAGRFGIDHKIGSVHRLDGRQEAVASLRISKTDFACPAALIATELRQL